MMGIFVEYQSDQLESISGLELGSFFTKIQYAISISFHMFHLFADSHSDQKDEITEQKWPINGQIKGFRADEQI